MDNFWNLIKFLLKNKYVLCIDQLDEFYFVKVSGRNIKAGFCTKNNGQSYPYIDGKIAADHKECFDKWSKCPLCLPIPENEEQLNFLLEKLIYLGSEEGFELSSNYEFDFIETYKENV